MTWRERMVDFLFPPKCPFCRRVTEGQRVCPQCEKALPWTEGKDREQTLPGGLRCASPLWYEDLAREGILRFKFHGGAGAEVLGALLADCAAERRLIAHGHVVVHDKIELGVEAQILPPGLQQQAARVRRNGLKGHGQEPRGLPGGLTAGGVGGLGIEVHQHGGRGAGQVGTVHGQSSFLSSRMRSRRVPSFETVAWR